MSTIVILDDRITNRRILSELASTLEEGAVVTAFADPVEALEWIKDNTVDLVITDYKMPHMDGAEFIRRFRHLPSCFDVPVMVVTIYEDQEFRYHALEAGATDFLLSPVDHHEFRARSRNLLALRQQQQIIKNRAYALEQKLAQDHQVREEVLRESRERLRAVIDTVPAMLYACDSDLRLMFLNRYTAALAGIPSEEAIGRPAVEVLGETFGREGQELDLRVLNSGEAVTDREQLFVDRDGVSHVMLATKSPLSNGAGRVDAVVTSAIDITERKRAEIETLAAKETAEIASRAKTEFLANMSHELRTPLNAIMGFAQMMSTEALGPIGTPKYRDYARDIDKSADHLLSLIKDILDISKIEVGRMDVDDEWLNVGEIFADIARLISERARDAGIRVETEVPKALPRLRADPTKVKQILLNLLANALKFTAPGGRVWVTGRQREDGAIVIAVGDTGIGMDEEETSLALSRFGRVDNPLTRKHSGAGLGLPLVMSLAEVHGGTCTIDSEKGAGTTVTIVFPPERAERSESVGA